MTYYSALYYRLMEKYTLCETPDSFFSKDPLSSFAGNYSSLINQNWPVLVSNPLDSVMNIRCQWSGTSLVNPNLLNMLKENYSNFSTESKWASYSRDDIVSKLRMLLKNKNIVVVGAGGFMSNMLYLIALLSKEATGFYGANAIRVYDDDTFSIDNLLRIYAPLYRGIQSYDAGVSINKACLLANTIHTIAPFLVFCQPSRLDREEMKRFDMKKTIFIGSPDISTRKMFKEDFPDADFFFFGHHKDTTEVIYRPGVDGDAAIETYGRMCVNKFWAGIMDSTIRFIRRAYKMVEHKDERFEPGESLGVYKAASSIADK